MCVTKEDRETFEGCHRPVRPPRKKSKQNFSWTIHGVYSKGNQKWDSDVLSLMIN